MGLIQENSKHGKVLVSVISLEATHFEISNFEQKSQNIERKTMTVNMKIRLL